MMNLNNTNPTENDLLNLIEQTYEEANNDSGVGGYVVSEEMNAMGIDPFTLRLDNWAAWKDLTATPESLNAAYELVAALSSVMVNINKIYKNRA